MEELERIRDRIFREFGIGISMEIIQRVIDLNTRNSVMVDQWHREEFERWAEQFAPTYTQRVAALAAWDRACCVIGGAAALSQQEQSNA